MLEPHDRSTLMEIVRPPVGYQLDCAVGTTYSLDLLAMLFVPLAFTMFEWEREREALEGNFIPMLESLRRHADRYSVFCQAGHISVPAQQSPLFAYLEQSVHEVVAPKENGVFHPKMWALRFVGEEDSVRYRVLCLSRNLTFDRSWDTALVLEGPLVDRQNAFAMNHPLGDFFAALPGLAVHPLSGQTTGQIALVAHELRRVQFDLPDGFEAIRFWPMGVPGHTVSPFTLPQKRLMVISPFVGEKLLDDLAQSTKDSILISRADELDAVSKECLAQFKQVFCLDTPAAPDDEPDGATTQPALQGLHAKAFIADDRWDTSIWTGSANATNAAFHSNVEFLVELQGKKSRCGIDVLLNSDGTRESLSSLLVPYERGQVSAESELNKRLEQQLDQAVRQLAATPPRGTATPDGDGYALHLHSDFVLPQDLSASCWPITLASPHALHWNAGEQVQGAFGQVTFDALTTFFAFEVRLADAQLPPRRFVLNLPMEGLPDDRRQRLLKSLLSDPEQVMRFILLLLAEQSPDFPGLGALAPITRNGGGYSSIQWDELPLFEALVKALHHDPSLLDYVQKLVEDLNEGEDAKLLPDGFMQLWEPVWAARQELGK